MDGKSNDRKNEIAVVSKRVENTKKEIYHLEAELHKLISTGINNTNKHTTVSTDIFDKENLVYNNIEQKTEPQPRITFKNFSDTRQIAESKLDNAPRRVLHKQIPLITITRSNPSSSKEKINQISKEHTKKNCDYDREKAREYIRKQKEKRLEEAKALKQSQNTIAIKKQKLKELHHKSVQLVTKNVELKKERSRSCESNEQIKKNIPNTNKEEMKTVRTDIPHLSVANDLESYSNNTAQIKQPHKNSESSKSSLEVKIHTHPQLRNVTIRKSLLVLKS